MTRRARHVQPFLLAALSDHPRSARELGQMTGISWPSSVSNALAHMVRVGKADRIGRGQKCAFVADGCTPRQVQSSRVREALDSRSALEVAWMTEMQA